MTAAPIALENASKYYGEILGISDVSLTVAGGIVGAATTSCRGWSW